MAGGTHTQKQREAAIEAAARLVDLGAPANIAALTIQRQHRYSRAQAYRILSEAGERRGRQGIRAKPTGEELIVMAQQSIAVALASATEAGEWAMVGKLGKELRESLKANGSVTTVAPPDPDQLAEQVQQTRIAAKARVAKQ